MKPHVPLDRIGQVRAERRMLRLVRRKLGLRRERKLPDRPELADVARVSRASRLLTSASARPGGSAAKTVDTTRSFIKQREITILEFLMSWTFSSDWRVTILFRESLVADPWRAAQHRKCEN